MRMSARTHLTQLLITDTTYLSIHKIYLITPNQRVVIKIIGIYRNRTNDQIS